MCARPPAASVDRLLREPLLLVVPRALAGDVVQLPALPPGGFQEHQRQENGESPSRKGGAGQGGKGIEKRRVINRDGRGIEEEH